MNLGAAKLVYLVSCVLLGVIILLPTLAEAIALPGGEKFSELWVLGSDRMAEGYPFDVSAGELNRVWLGVGNHLGGLSYYRVYVKLRNESEQLPNSTAASPSSLEPVYSYDLFLGENATWEREVSFSFGVVSFDDGVCRVSRVLVDDYAVDVNKMAAWNATENGFYCEVFFELWLYNAAVMDFQFHNRWVGLWLNMSSQV